MPNGAQVRFDFRGPPLLPVRNPKREAVALAAAVDATAVGGGIAAGILTAPFGPAVAIIAGAVVGAALGDIGASNFAPELGERLSVQEQERYTFYSRFLPELPAVIWTFMDRERT